MTVNIYIFHYPISMPRFEIVVILHASEIQGIWAWHNFALMIIEWRCTFVSLSYINAALVQQTGQLAAELAHVHDDAGVHVQVDRASALPVKNPIQTKLGQTKCVRKIRAKDTDRTGVSRKDPNKGSCTPENYCRICFSPDPPSVIDIFATYFNRIVFWLKFGLYYIRLYVCSYVCFFLFCYPVRLLACLLICFFVSLFFAV